MACLIYFVPDTEQFIHHIYPIHVILFIFIGICGDVAVSKHEYWSSLAPLPFEVVVSAGQKAKEECWEKG
jgi:hypothetical protein